MKKKWDKKKCFLFFIFNTYFPISPLQAPYMILKVNDNEKIKEIVVVFHNGKKEPKRKSTKTSNKRYTASGIEYSTEDKVICLDTHLSMRAVQYDDGAHRRTRRSDFDNTMESTS